MSTCGRHSLSQCVWALLTICALSAGCQSFPTQPAQGKYFDTEGTMHGASPDALGSTISVASAVGANSDTPPGFAVLPALHPRCAEYAGASGTPDPQIQRAGFHQDLEPQPKVLPEPNFQEPSKQDPSKKDPNKKDPSKPDPGKSVPGGEPPLMPLTGDDEKPAANGSVSESQVLPAIGFGTHPDNAAPQGIANRCKNCSWVRRMGLTMDIPVKDAPKEMQLVTSPAYIIQPPDIILVESPRSLPDQPIAGEHLVRADGKISLGLYGDVRVAGLTVEQAREAIQKHLSTIIREPQVNVDIYSYNSTFYYIIYDGAGYGESLTKLSFTGHETVLDALALIGGIPTVSSKRRIWIARPIPNSPKCAQILPVDWEAIVKCGETATNYQIFPGDRIYIQSERLQALDGLIAKIVSPMERVLGLTLLAAFNVQRYQNLGRNPGLQQITPTNPVIINGGVTGGGGAGP